MNDLAIIIPRVKADKLVDVRATIQGEKWRTDDPGLRRTLGYLHLDTGHHADRDLELAMLAVRYLGGKVEDNRPKAKNLEKLPR